MDARAGSVNIVHVIFASKPVAGSLNDSEMQDVDRGRARMLRRALQIVNALVRSRKAVHTSDLADQLNVCNRTIWRDALALRAAGWPIEITGSRIGAHLKWRSK